MYSHRKAKPIINGLSQGIDDPLKRKLSLYYIGMAVITLIVLSICALGIMLGAGYTSDVEASAEASRYNGRSGKIVSIVPDKHGIRFEIEWNKSNSYAVQENEGGLLVRNTRTDYQDLAKLRPETIIKLEKDDSGDVLKVLFYEREPGDYVRVKVLATAITPPRDAYR